MVRLSDIPRLPDWEARLSAWISDALAKPHAYGRHDCLLLCAGDIRAVIGKDPARGHRGQYRSALGAAKYLKQLGFDTPAELLDFLLDPIPVAKAMRGDIVLAEVPGICIGSEGLFVGQGRPNALAADVTGLVRVPRREWTRAWAVGRRGV